MKGFLVPPLFAPILFGSERNSSNVPKEERKNKSLIEFIEAYMLLVVIIFKLRRAGYMPELVSLKMYLPYLKFMYNLY